MLDYRQLKHLRLLHELTQTEIAKELKISRNYISMVENNTRKYSQEWHDNFVKTIYILHERKKNGINIVDEIIEIAEVLDEPSIKDIEVTEQPIIETEPTIDIAKEIEEFEVTESIKVVEVKDKVIPKKKALSRKKNK
ncbi:helix-turn-helix transcriptional regulator [Clostridium estertheticum]|uniref:helix-turn-helix domain-containing protein n=1 Tax=Clostridium estertheticum TaxID=238834 RepID=UPI001C0C4371|nr:helix-turn-helix transcriptional regulator [Clostridium estertheticum]MBU3215870.1 helix-turn-helix transcriptional regulator [Clostridium estertheticum]WAG57826.1 helix-turn-helix transcriptional regulator [Clostridium estertheticum]